MKTSLFLIASCIALSGCSSTHRKAAQTAPLPVTAQIGAEAAPYVANAPIDLEPSNAPSRDVYAAKAVYRAPKIRKIHIEPYTDEAGNAYGPQVKYIVEDQGGWNMDALRNPSKAYIPPAMSKAMTSPGSYTVPNTGETPVPEKTKSIRELYKMDSVIVTGLVEYGQESLAKEMEAKAGDQYQRYFDEKMGWLLVLKSVLQTPQELASP